MRVTLSFSALVLLLACQPVKPPVVTPSLQRAVPPPPIVDDSRGRQAIPGRISAELSPSLWMEGFSLENRNGLSRLRSGTELWDLLSCYRPDRVWRKFPQVEWRTDGVVRVISYGEWHRRIRAKLPLRANQRSMEPYELRDAATHFEFKFADTTDLDDVVERMQRVPGVISARVVRRAPTAFIPNDPGWLAAGAPGYDAQLARGRWGMHNTGAALGAAYLDDFDIDAPEAWDIQRGSQSVAVAVLDSHIDVAHDDLYLNIFLNNGEVPPSIVTAHRAASAGDGLPSELTFHDLNEPPVVAALTAAGYVDTNTNGYIDGEDVVAWWSNGDDADLNGYTDDLVGWNFEDGTNRPFEPASGLPDGHGTGSAGLISAIADNNRHIAGIAHRVRILPIRTAMSIAEVAYASFFPQVRVINESISGWFAEGNADVNDIMRTLDGDGILYLASLGNRDGYYFGSDPSKREQVMSIANFGSDGVRAAGASGYGPKTDVAAPAQDVWSLQYGGGVMAFGGTSGASPMTAAVAALLASQSPTRTPEQLRQLLRMTANDPATVTGDRGENRPGWDLYSGWGLVNAKSSLDAIVAGRVFPAANIVSRPRNFRNAAGEDLAIGRGVVPIHAIVGLPGTTVTWRLRRSPSWDFTGAVVVASGTTAFSDGTTAIASIDTDPLDGRQVLELEATSAAGVTSRERAVIDLPRAYISNLRDGQAVMTTPVEGFAYGPGFLRYRIQVAPGWIPSAAAFVDVTTSTTESAPSLPVQAGDDAWARSLLSSLDTGALPITVPATGEVTLRVRTEGARTWTHDVKLIASPHPPLRAGFPLPGFYTARPSPTAADLDGDGVKELIAGGSEMTGAIKVFRADGTPFPGFPAWLPAGEYLFNSPAVGDVDGDGRLDIVTRSYVSETRAAIRVIRSDGTLVSSGFPVLIETPPTYASSAAADRDSPPVLADVTGDGRLDILVAVNRVSAGAAPEIRAIDGRTGTTLRSFAASTDCDFVSPPAVGDIDGDGRNDIAAGVGRVALFNSVLYVWRNDGTVMWSVALPSIPAEGPILIDVDGDERLEVVSGSRQNYLRVYDDNGTQLARETIYPIRYSWSAVQFDPSASSSIALLYSGRPGGTADRTMVHAVDAATVVERTGWPVTFVAAGSPAAEPIAADFAGDSALEVAYGNAPWMTTAGQLVLFGIARSDGTLVSNSEWPIRFSGGLEATPLISDLDADGHPELVIQCSRPDSSIYAFNLAVSTHNGWVSWGEFRHNPKKTSNYHGDLQILSPTTVGRTHVGPFDDVSQQAALLVRAHFSRGVPLNDTNPSNWRVTIGGMVAPVREVQRLQGDVWLITDPIAQPSAGARTLRVEFNDGGIRTWDSYRDAVVYDSAAVRHSTIAVIDKSGSMRSDGKIDAARVAARFFAESAYPADEVGVVAFNQLAENRLGSAGLLVAGTNMATISNAITTTSPIGLTSIGAGLSLGLTILNGYANPAFNWSLVLLSDGLENTAPFWERTGWGGPIRPWAEILSYTRDFRIHTVALGPDADQALLEEIADVTGGTYYPVALGHSLSMLNRLADVYHFARERVDNTQRLFTHGSDIGPASNWSRPLVVPAQARRLQFALNLDQPLSSNVNLEIRRPGGALVAAPDPGVTFTTGTSAKVVTIAAPEPGQWTVAIANSSKAAVEVLLVASAAIPMRVGTIVRRSPGLHASADLAAFVLGPRGLVRDAALTALITLPTKETLTVDLRDDGRSGDGAKGDGIAGATVPFEIPGSYQFAVQAAVPSGLETPITIAETTGRFNHYATDRDADGIPDEWEREVFACGAALSPGDDPDRDGLSTSEELHSGTDPFDSDTDDDGYSDGEEVRKAREPLKSESSVRSAPEKGRGEH